jgi:hypothetical protein
MSESKVGLFPGAQSFLLCLDFRSLVLTGQPVDKQTDPVGWV